VQTLIETLRRRQLNKLWSILWAIGVIVLFVLLNKITEYTIESTPPLVPVFLLEQKEGVSTVAWVRLDNTNVSVDKMSIRLIQGEGYRVGRVVQLFNPPKKMDVMNAPVSYYYQEILVDCQRVELILVRYGYYDLTAVHSVIEENGATEGTFVPAPGSGTYQAFKYICKLPSDSLKTLNLTSKTI